MAVAFSSQLDILGQPIPAWNPLDWDFTVMQNVIDQSINGVYRPAWEHTFIYVAIAMSLCVLIGYPVAYYVARLAGGNRGLLLALILAPWWINYLTRMLAWVGILGDEGYANDIVGFFGFAKVDWLGGQWYVVVAGACLRLPAVLHRSALRLPRPDRPAAHRGLARPRRELVPDVLPRHPSAQSDRRDHRDGDHGAADVR